jgi:predicted nucleotidyltransferase
MELCCLKRRGEDYHSSRLITASYASASAIREGIFNALSSATDASSALELLGSQIPVQIQPQVTELLRQSAFVHPDDLSLLLHYKLSQETDLSRYFDCTPELSRRILSYRYDFNGYQDLCDLIKTKNVTHSRISRVLCHTLLNITDDLMASHRPGNPMPYLRILGFRRSAEVLLPRLQENTTIPIVTAVARASSLLSADAYRFFQKDIEAADLYRALELRQPRGFLTDGRAASQPKTVQRVSPTEYTRKLLVMES